jgi:hypothetical protein
MILAAGEVRQQGKRTSQTGCSKQKAAVNKRQPPLSGIDTQETFMSDVALRTLTPTAHLPLTVKA